MRARLAEQQRGLLMSLCGAAPVPPDFDAKAVEACGVALLRKRARAAARAWPALEQSLGEEAFRERFLAFARLTPLVEEGGPLAEGYGFFRTMNAEELSDAARLEKLAVEMRYRWSRRGLIPRRGFAIRVVKLKGRRVVALRLPWVGVWSFVVGC
jgi:hypothetical protein